MTDNQVSDLDDSTTAMAQQPQAGLACTALSMSLREPLSGSAGWASTWLLIENRDSWASHAVKDLLPPPLRELLSPVRWNTQLVRELDDRRTEGSLRVWLVDVASHTTWQWSVEDSEAQFTLIASLAAGAPNAPGRVVEQPFLLVCTNGKRDACCALFGRAVLTDLVHGHMRQAGLAESHPLALESTHLGGHRFSPVVVALPSSYQYRCADATQAEAILEAAKAGLIHPQGLRGSTMKQSPEQVVELELRNRLNQWHVDTPWVAQTSIDSGVAHVVGECDGTAFEAQLTLRTGQPRRESCVGDPKPLHWWELTSLSQG